MSDVPLFINEEKDEFCRIVESPRFNSFGKFLLTVRVTNSSGFSFEKFAAAYLLMNATLMTRTSQRIIKMVCLPELNANDSYSFVNALRGLFDSEFSGLSSINHWQKILKENFIRSKAMLNAVERAIEFIENSEIGSSTSTYNKAKIYIGLSKITPSHKMGGLFLETPVDIFRSRVYSKGPSFLLNFSEIYRGKNNLYKIGNLGQNHSIEFYSSDIDPCISEMMDNINIILGSEFYSKPELVS